MRKEKLTEEQMVRVQDGETQFFPAGGSDMIRVRKIKDRVVIDKVTQEYYNRRYGTSGVGGSA